MRGLIVVGALVGFIGLIGYFAYYYSQHQVRQQELILQQEQEKAEASTAEKERIAALSKKAAEDRQYKLEREARQRQLEAQQQIKRELAEEEEKKKRAADQAKLRQALEAKEQLRQAELAAIQAKEREAQERQSAEIERQKKAEAAKRAGEVLEMRKQALQSIAKTKATLTQAKRDQTAAQNRINGALREMKAGYDDAISWAKQMGYNKFELPYRANSGFPVEQPQELSYYWGWYDPSLGKGASMPGGLVITMDTREQIGKAKARYDRAVKEYTNMKALLDKANTDVQAGEQQIRASEDNLRQANESLTSLGIDPGTETTQVPKAETAPPGESSPKAANTGAMDAVPVEVDLEKEMENGLKAMFLMKDKTTVYAYMVMRSGDQVVVKTKDGAIRTLKNADIEKEIPMERKKK